ncbi:MAG TPA: hypothetical protein VMJ34_01360 [Bryobacteraceae bacterium]|nr:hypothetical protein [Bryobacteraceae bacterium]
MKALNTTILGIAMAFGALALYAQAPSTDAAAQQQSGQWRKVGSAPAAQPADTVGNQTLSAPDGDQAGPPPPEDEQDQAPPPPENHGWQSSGGPAPQQQGGWTRFGGTQQQPPPPRKPMPASITLPAGTWVSFRVNQPISSDHSQQGDAFMGTLAEPLVSNGIVIARRGQTVEGRVTLAQKAGRVSGTSKLGVEITEIGIADGQQINVHTQMVERRGDTSYGRDATAIGATTATGAIIGAGVNDGVGAGVGAAAGLVASTVGVLLTRGKPTVLYPEQVLTFRLIDPVTVKADFNNEAFQPVSQQDYERSSLRAYGPRPAPSLYGGYYGYGYGYPYPYYGPYYYGAYYPWFWGPSFGVRIYGGGFYRGGYHGGYHGGGGHHR